MREGEKESEQTHNDRLLVAAVVGIVTVAVVVVNTQVGKGGRGSDGVVGLARNSRVFRGVGLCVRK